MPYIFLVRYYFSKLIEAADKGLRNRLAIILRHMFEALRIP